ncbi:hypothetical protein BT69DRAFT_611014 [Atractiella rhizophila]|nr:hypothetical protein BT69DRAFT_611014 [Atractiella rhizophila]
MIQRTLSENQVTTLPDGHLIPPLHLRRQGHHGEATTHSLPGSPPKEKARLLSESITFQDIKSWASKPINGRMINEIVRTAKLLATAEGQTLRSSHVETVLNLTLGFHDDYSAVDEEGFVSVYFVDRFFTKSDFQVIH